MRRPPFVSIRRQNARRSSVDGRVRGPKISENALRNRFSLVSRTAQLTLRVCPELITLVNLGDRRLEQGHTVPGLHHDLSPPDSLCVVVIPIVEVVRTVACGLLHQP